MSLALLSWNVNGLVDPIKIKGIKSVLHGYDTAVVMLQETHLKANENIRLNSRVYELVIHATYDHRRKRGVAILF